MLRRDVLLGGALTLIWANFGCGCSAARAGGHGCVLDAAAFSGLIGGQQAPATRGGGERLFNSSGDREFDAAIAGTLARLDALFDVAPGFAFYDDSGAPNAFATPSTQLGRDDGSVAYGQTLLRRLLAGTDHPDAGVASVVAHEFGHVVQFKRGIFQRLLTADNRVKQVELHADFLAGYFAGSRRLERPDFPAAVFANTQFAAGDNMRENPQHHGTPEERGRAVVAGYQAAFRDRQSFAEALATGQRYVAAITA